MIEESNTSMSSISQLYLEGSKEKKSKHLLITGLCNNNCMFCFSEKLLKKANYPLPSLKEEMEEGLKQGCDKLVLSGGEPTIHPEFQKIIKLGRQLGYNSVQAITNGRMFAYKKFMDRSIKNGLDEITFSIHGDNSALHDNLTCAKGSFIQSITGLKNALARDLFIQVKIVINKQNIQNLERIIDYFISLGTKNFELLNLVPEGNAWENKDKLFFDISKYKVDLTKLFSRIKKQGIVINLNRFQKSTFPDHIDSKQQYLKKLNELNIRKGEFLEKKGKKLSCFTDKCNLCFISKECKDLQKIIPPADSSKIDDLFDEVLKDERT